uniref:EF-hand domain-containing protein n=1 Tax=Euplotes harpa TaxID=151035 RepID=A0A7S3NFH6_9SPIT|mmetsp:Transcript_6311/g.7245  ORF Transcript_6311/g.7245 Transcript_6311/m.7245 type:complete len:100 (+) Transcript_6311:39-338(+)|eukprot:CAMPEP_0168342644 /NCGR_PEP_ID=MMETSP0213-20121227/15526_1 /TAXON_ID=151035 /ORGANISM="Euplotes harpa, Strain FSP1.4" /LENGTH=99 /DNA_ID=CAMNT_0008349599 /DNA_START=10 /DNA_END=309 /DNA_ORIENTATION=+
MTSLDVKAILEDDDKLTDVAHTAFTQIDTDGSGFIERNEIKESLKYLFTSVEDGDQTGPTEEQVDEAFKEIDTSGDGKITFQEYKEFTKSIMTSIAEAS